MATNEAASTTAGAAGSGDLVLTRLTKTYGPFKAVDDLSLTIPRGSFFALLGPSGCGKTTTLRMVAGLEEPTVGAISIGATDITSTKPYQRPVNTVFQSYALFPHMTIWDNVAFGLQRRKQKNVKQQVDDVLELTELTALAKRKPTQLSGGQQQRVALARAIVNRPDVLLLDEPLGALDLKLRRQMQVELKRIQTEVGLTFVHVTHDQEEAMTMADTIAVMNKGRIEQLGAPAELYENPQTTFVANFLGQSNIVRAAVKERGSDSAVVALPAGQLRVPLSRIGAAGDELLVGVRPEKVKLHDEPITDADGPVGENVIGGCIVTDVSFIGVSTQYLVRAPWGQELMVFEQNQGIENLNKVGDPVAMSFAPAHTFALDASQDVEAGIDPDGVL